MDRTDDGFWQALDIVDSKSEIVIGTTLNERTIN